MIGLEPTRSFQQYLTIVEGRHSPFDRGRVLYPFIVVEAKADTGPGFPSIERQSAFAIRTCLKLQQKLSTRTGVGHECLVWFFASQGEEWRVYAAVLEGDKTVSLVPLGPARC